MKIRDLVIAQPLLRKVNAQPMPGKLAYVISKNLRLVNQELSDFEAARIKMLETKWKLNEKTNQFDIPPEDQPEAQKMFDELLDQEVKFEPVKFGVNELDHLTLSPDEVTAIRWMIAE